MKTARSVTCVVVLILCLFPKPCMAQETSECEPLNTKIHELENMDLAEMTSSMRQFHKEALLKLYKQLSECLDREIQVATERRKALTDAEAASNMEQHLRKLAKKRSELAGKITIIQTLLDPTSEKQLAGDNTRVPTRTEKQSNMNAERSAGNGERASSKDPSSLGDPATTVVKKPSVATADAAPIQANCAPSASYDDAPGILKDLASGLALDIINADKPDIAAQAGPQMVLYTVFDAASPKSSELVHALESYHYLGETARTDKQLGGSSDSDGAISGIEKPGFAQLLGFALEHGGITKENDGTNLTLSSTLYSLYALGNKDTAENYARAGILNRVGLSATFAVQNQDDELANARRNNLTEWSAKVRLFGDRSTRSPGFQRVFAEKIKPRIRDRLRTLGRSIEQLANNNSQYDTLEDDALTELPNDVKARMACPDYVAATTTIPEKQQMLAAVILGRLRTKVYVPVSTRKVDLGNEVARIEGEYLPNLKRALDNLVLANDDLKNAIEDLQKGPLATFAFTNHRIPTGSDYSEAKFLFEQEKGFMGPLKLTGNLGFSFYNRPDRSLNQEKVRDIFAALSFEGSSDSPFTEAENQSKITYSFVGRYQRLLENRGIPGRTADIGSLQFVTEIPLFRGLSLPFSITYSSATEEEKKQGFRFNFGTRFDMDKLVELLRANSRR